MVFGYLLGGMLTGMGKQMQQEKARQHQEDLWKQSLLFDMVKDQITKRGMDMTPEEYSRHMKVLDDTLKTKGVFGSLVPFAHQLYPHLTPPERTTAPTGGGIETSGKQAPDYLMQPPAPLPSPDAGGAPAPALPPMPSRPPDEYLSFRQTGPTALPPMPAMPTPLSGTYRERDMQKAISDIDASDLPDEVKVAAKAKIMAGLNLIPYMSTELKAGGAGTDSGAFVNYKAPDGKVLRVWEYTKGPNAGITLDPNTLEPFQLPQGSVRMGTQGKDQLQLVKDPQTGTATVVNLNAGTTKDVGKVMTPQTVGTGNYKAYLDPTGQFIAGWYNTKDPTKTILATTKNMRMTTSSEQSQTKYDLLETMTQMLNMVHGLVKMPKVQDAIGPVMGRYTDWTRGILEKDDEVNETFRIAADLGDILLRARSGAQINEQEYQRLKRLVPDPSTPLKRFKSDLGGFTSELNAVLKRRGLPTIESELGVWAVDEEGKAVPKSTVGEKKGETKGGEATPPAGGGKSVPMSVSAIPGQFPVYVTIPGESGEPIEVESPEELKVLQSQASALGVKLEVVDKAVTTGKK